MNDGRIQWVWSMSLELFRKSWSLCVTVKLVSIYKGKSQLSSQLSIFLELGFSQKCHVAVDRALHKLPTQCQLDQRVCFLCVYINNAVPVVCMIALCVQKYSSTSTVSTVIQSETNSGWLESSTASGSSLREGNRAHTHPPLLWDLYTRWDICTLAAR